MTPNEQTTDSTVPNEYGRGSPSQQAAVVAGANCSTVQARGTAQHSMVRLRRRGRRIFSSHVGLYAESESEPGVVCKTK